LDDDGTMIRRILIANRGEIAIRVIRACRELGIRAIAVYSEADAESPHVAAADEAVLIGPAPASESYLKIPVIIEAARRSKADAIHPGYGFLSENAGFAAACEAAGITFIGPPSAVIARMGSKTGAREAMQKAGVPVVPGDTPRSQSDADLLASMKTVGFPLLLKAASGGGGKGMRTVRSAAEALEAIGAARREAERAFGAGALYVERLIERPRHIEVQIFADAHGSIVHLFERDCTLQRRHQKVVEEAPAPTLTAAVRARITEAALLAARTVGYVNAGTIEFLLEGSGDDARFYFLEMNTRLQVEHPVTEAITGLDLVHAQITVAGGGRLPFTQADVAARGHAVECRIYAEDSVRLLPQAGRLVRYREPGGEGVRIDSGVREGQTITVHYDPLLAKLIVHAGTREAALDQMMTALRSYEILGVRHNLPFLQRLLARPEIRTHATHTRFIEEHLDELARPAATGVRQAAAAIAAYIVGTGAGMGVTGRGAASMGQDPWQTLGPVAW
jgi:acetyl-CoA carboxylase biotin carboxylase subunit